jgi:hypothetical protein
MHLFDKHFTTAIVAAVLDLQLTNFITRVTV